MGMRNFKKAEKFKKKVDFSQLFSYNKGEQEIA